MTLEGLTRDSVGENKGDDSPATPKRMREGKNERTGISTRRGTQGAVERRRRSSLRVRMHWLSDRVYMHEDRKRSTGKKRQYDATRPQFNARVE